MLGSLMMLASGVFACSPNSINASDCLWLSVRFSGKFAIILPAREISSIVISMPAGSVKVLMIGSREHVANAGASSVFV